MFELPFKACENRFHLLTREQTKNVCDTFIHLYTTFASSLTFVSLVPTCSWFSSVDKVIFQSSLCLCKALPLSARALQSRHQWVKNQDRNYSHLLTCTASRVGFLLPYAFQCVSFYIKNMNELTILLSVTHSKFISMRFVSIFFFLS